MVEWLAIPEWNAPPRTLDDWLAALAGSKVVRDEDGDRWIEVPRLRVRGLLVEEEGRVEIINFELHADDPEPALTALRAAADSINWELHADDDDEED